MTMKLVVMIVAAAASAVGLAALCQFVFPDVLPYASGDGEVESWRRLAAFLIETTAWISAEVSGLLAIVLAAHLWRQRSTKAS